MRISTISVVLAVAAAGALAWPVTQAFAMQDQPVTIGGVESVCTGVGSAKDNPAWAGYPIKLVFANPKGEDLADVHVSIMQGGKSLVETECDAPWVLMKLPAGSYNVSASVPGNAGARMGKASFSTKGGPQQTVTVMLPRSGQPQ